MSAFAGIYYYKSEGPVEPQLCARLNMLINRSDENIVTEFDLPGFYVVHIDVGAFGHASFARRQNDGALIVAGQLLFNCVHATNRTSEIDQLAISLANNSTALLSSARGTFCLADYSPIQRRLLLAVDRLGVRPLYYYDDGQLIVFSTALRVFEGIAEDLGLHADVQAVSELNSFGYVLGNRTPFKEVSCLRGGEARFFSNSHCHAQFYWRWDQLPECPDEGVDLARKLNITFMDAVKIRLGNDRLARAFLSGGLDSRCIVTALKSLGIETHTYNISPRNSYDEVIGAAYAERIDTHHHAFMLPADKAGWAWPQMIAETLNEHPVIAGEGRPDRQRVVWSGDGGSVGLGRVYLDEAMVKALRAGDVQSAARQFLAFNKIAVPRGVLRKGIRERLAELLLQATIEELTRFDCADPGKAMLLFLLENDQRRHMASFYEEIDRNRVEYQMPFFDGEFLAAAVALPFDTTLYHRFYNAWLRTFDNVAVEVPWQAYPGHEPCPLQLPLFAEYQWGRGLRGSCFARRLNQVKIGLAWALGRDLPTSVFSRGRMMAASMAAAFTGRDYYYLLNAPYKFVHYLRICRFRDA